MTQDQMAIAPDFYFKRYSTLGRGSQMAQRLEQSTGPQEGGGSVSELMAIDESF